MQPAEFEPKIPAIEPLQMRASDRVTNGIGATHIVAVLN